MKDRFPLNPVHDFSEEELIRWGREKGKEFLLQVSPAPKVLLDGPLGAGKSTLTRAILEGLGVDRPPEGSPTFALAHEYISRTGQRVIHADLYRVKSENEIEEAGLIEAFWDPEVLLICEWAAKFPQIPRDLKKSFPALMTIAMNFHEGAPNRRQLTIF